MENSDKVIITNAKARSHIRNSIVYHVCKQNIPVETARLIATKVYTELADINRLARRAKRTGYTNARNRYGDAVKTYEDGRDYNFEGEITT